MTRLLVSLGLLCSSPLADAHPGDMILSCEQLLDTPQAHAARARAHAIFAAGEADDEVTVAYVGLSNGQLIELLNEGEVRADRWGPARLYAYVVAGPPAVERLRASMPDVEVAEQPSKFQFDSARDDAWSRSVVELMEAPHRDLRNDDFLGFLQHLRIELRSKTWANPTIRQITEATTMGDLPKARGIKRYGELRTLARLLGVPWESAMTQTARPIVRSPKRSGTYPRTPAWSWRSANVPSLNSSGSTTSRSCA